LGKNVKLDIATNCALATLIFSVGVVCLFPVDNAVTTDGSESNVYRCAPTETEGVSLMFNVYWGTDVVYRILDILDAHDAKATFFIGGCWADDNVACVKEILARGHEMGNHGYFHKDHSALTEQENKEEISLCNEFIRLMTGKEMTLFAPPSGAYGKTMLSVCETLNMKTILWSRDTIDWRDKNAALIYTRATKEIKGGEFVLMHPMSETADALDDILVYYEKSGLKLLTVSENLSR
jgi:peptidoglycan/xylan/chitin deacetylase (PgdA/CDA1 family)